MEEKLIYIGFVCFNEEEEEYTLVTKKDDIFLRIPIADKTKIFEKVSDNRVKIVGCKFFDGTEQVSLNYGYERNFEDIIIHVGSDASIEIDAEEPIYSLISKNYIDMITIWNLVVEFFESEEGKILLQDFIENDPWENIK